MKKVLKIALIFVLMILAYTTVVNAATTDELIAYASKTFTIAGKQVKLSNADVLKVKRFLSENPVSESQGDTIISKGNQIISIMNSEGVSDVTKLSKAKKEQALSLAQEAASVVGATLTYDSTDKAVTIYKDGKAVDSASLVNYKLVQTGSDNTVYVVAGVVAVIAVATVVLKKRKVNA